MPWMWMVGLVRICAFPVSFQPCSSTRLLKKPSCYGFRGKVLAGVKDQKQKTRWSVLRIDKVHQFRTSEICDGPQHTWKRGWTKTRQSLLMIQVIQGGVNDRWQTEQVLFDKKIANRYNTNKCKMMYRQKSNSNFTYTCSCMYSADHQHSEVIHWSCDRKFPKSIRFSAQQRFKNPNNH